MSFCRNCGKELKDGDKYCYNCGSPSDGKPVPKRKLMFLIIGTIAVLLIAIAALIIALVLAIKGPAPPEPDNSVQDTDSISRNVTESADSPSDSAAAEQNNPGSPAADSEDEAAALDSAKKELDKDKKKNDIGKPEDLARNVIDEIEGQSGYLENPTWTPLCVMDDFNGDGIQEFLAVYEKKDGNLFEAVYDLWSLPETGAVPIESKTLFAEAGGNNGAVGIVKGTDAVYLGIQRSEPDGSTLNNYESYCPWNPEKSILDPSSVYLESHEKIDIPGASQSQAYDYYILGDTQVDKTAFEERKNDFSNWVYKLQLTQGAGGGVLTFDELCN